jgi:hypothetical protein
MEVALLSKLHYRLFVTDDEFRQFRSLLNE